MSYPIALTSDDSDRARDDRASGTGIVLAGDRSREFRRARWHSMIVRSLRIGFPLAGIGFTGLYIWTMLSTAGYGTVATALTIAATLGKDVAMDNPRYEGFTKDGSAYTVTAKTAIPDLKNPSEVKLNAISGELFDAKKARTNLTAARGVFDSKANQLDLAGGITVVTQSGMRATLSTATLMTKEGTLVSGDPVKVEMPTGTVTSNRLNLDQKSKVVTFLDNVVARLTPADKPATAAPATPPPVAGLFGASRAPVDITADKLEIQDGRKSAEFWGRVRASQGPARLEADTLEVTYEGGAQTAVAPAAGGTPAQATRIRRIVAPGPVVLTQGTGDRVTGNSADFDALNEAATIIGNVVMTSGADRRAVSDRAEFQQKSDSVLLTGNVVVTQGRNELRGRRLAVDRKGGKTDLTAPADGAVARGRIFARLYQGDGNPGKPGGAKPAPAAAAAASPLAGGGFANFKTDPSAPIDIEADRMQVDDPRKEAVFTGDVKAAQGDFVIRTIQMQAFYSGEAGLASAALPGAGSPAAKTPAQLTRIEAKGKVVVTSKANQQVVGDWAIFDTKANTVTVGGAEVIVTQDQNILRGNKLTIDMTTGRSFLVREGEPAQASAEAARAGGAAAGAGKTKGRASMVFYPEERSKGGATPVKPAAPANPSSSSWEAATQPAAAPQ